MSNSTDVVRSFYDALGRGDVPGVLATLNDELEWTEAEHFPYYGGTWRTPQQIVDNLLIPLARDWDGFSAAAHEFIPSGERVVSLGTYAGTFKTTGRHMNTPYAHVWTVRNGRITRFDQFVDRLKVQEAMA
jgi:uncharacterized protein